MVFDARAAKMLAHGEHIVVPECPGLRLVATESRKSWIYRYRSPEDGRMRQIKLGEWPAMPIARAMALWDDARQQREAGIDLAKRRKEARAQEKLARQSARQPGTPARPGVAVTVLGLALQYAELYAKPRRKEKGYKELVRLVNSLLGDVGMLEPTEVTRGIAFDLIDRHAKERPVLAMSLRRELGSTWEWAIDSGRLPEDTPNWWRIVLKGKISSKGRVIDGVHQGAPVKRALSFREVGTILREMRFISPVIRDLLTLYLWTGCRGAEIVQMEGAEISRDERGALWWVIPRAKIKMARNPLAMDLRVPLIGRACEIVVARVEQYGQGYLFPARPGARIGHVAQKNVGVAVYNHAKRCRIRPELERMRWSVDDWAPHDLRRTVRTCLSSIGCSSDVAEAVLGHLPGGDEAVYDRHDYSESRREWLTKLVAEFERHEADPDAVIARPAA